ncbi:HEAT repeat-containing protein 4 isoform X1 [Pygocentrus nattereri]|uniref:HEAT repeat-containing protein 4 n=1 Tax=Pygocentrus nattereri TaxID=42514 RepID=A0A3B4ED58_PYGNA|nr:HEAT repeat-containing protein 4 isoform X1 [Pygocentrus nattereri]
MDLQQPSKGSMEYHHSRRGKQLYRQLLRNASEGLSFSQDVMWEMGADGISYSKADFSWLFRATGRLAPDTKPKSRKKAGTKVSPCHIGPKAQEKENELVGVPLPVLPPLQTTHYSHNSLTTKEPFTIPNQQGGMLVCFQRTELRGASNVYSCLKKVPPDVREEYSRNSKWNEFVLKKLTKTTAQWIVSQKIPKQSQHKEGLQSLLKGQYGSASATDLVTDEPMREADFCGFYDAPRSSSEPKCLQSSKAETPLPVYYRIQGYVFSPVCTDEQGGSNQTANTVTVKHTETPKPPRLQNSLNPHAGKYVYYTKNDFEQELYSGIAKQVHQRDRRNEDRIILDNNSEYQKNLQELFPCGPEKWTHVTEAKMGRVEKGLRRWMDLPTKADYGTELGLRPPVYTGQTTEVAKQQVHYKLIPELSSLRYAVEEWRNAWKIKITWQSVTVEGLKKSLTDLHCHVRLAAIATCALGAVHRPQEELAASETALYGRGWEVEPVPPELQPLLLSALSDPVKRVQIAAAVCQYAMGASNPHAQDILRNVLHQDTSGMGADSWVAAQCLALEGEATQAVVERLLSQHFLSEAPADQDQAATLLSNISSKTTLVRSRLSEELNCGNWRTRVLACNTLSQLKCQINKDLSNKLSHLMWNDWSSVVRQAAAQALGRLNLGSDLHDELIVKLDEGPASRRVEALVLIGQLKIMTIKLLPAFLRCLVDDFVVVRKQACFTAASLMLKDEIIMEQLIDLMHNDTSCDVKVVAINALGKIGCLTPALEELLLWALHHEEEPRVRIAACEALKTLGVKGPELQLILQERFVLEPNPQVHRHIEAMLKSYGYSLEGDKGMVYRITDQVQQLCSKNIITEKVLLLEELTQLQQHQRRLLGQEGQPEASVMSALLQERFTALKHLSTRSLSASKDGQDKQYTTAHMSGWTLKDD